ncbi:MAG: nonstructural protein [Arizlama microvirus]|nr:MAG: nonstructural protein [Arizlama microvirus]
MNIYAIRDRLLDYYMQPFAGPEDKAVLAAVARTINTQENMSDIAQAPHHFEVWRIGKVTTDGHIQQDRELIADCASLVRPGIRRTGGAEGPGAEIPPEGRRGAPGGPEARTHADDSAVQTAAHAAAGATAEARQRPTGGYNPRMRDTHEGDSG